MSATPILYATTTDGWRLPLHYFAASPGKKRRFPILMVHGFGANRLHFHFDDRHSFAQAARARGFDVYVLELRGAGLSRPPNAKPKPKPKPKPKGTGKGSGRGGDDRGKAGSDQQEGAVESENESIIIPQGYQWGFTEYAALDMPAAIAAVLSHARTDALHGVGHSMGGMLFSALGVETAAATAIKPLRSMVAIASPLISELNLGTREQRLIRIAAALTPRMLHSRVPLQKVLSVAGVIPLTTKLGAGTLFHGPNVDTDVMARMAREAINDVPLKLIREITLRMSPPKQWSAEFKDPYAYEDHLHRLDMPILALAGSHDRIAPARSVEAFVQRLRAAHVHHRAFGRSHGDRGDYGHVDLLVGRHAPEEIHPIMLDFLEESD